jgi:hypothetical protein
MATRTRLYPARLRRIGKLVGCSGDDVNEVLMRYTGDLRSRTDPDIARIVTAYLDELARRP